MFKVLFITPDDIKFENIKKIRKKVFIEELSADKEKEFDSLDEYGSPSSFALVYVDEIACGTGRLSLTSNGYKIGRIAILSEFRGKGYGEVIVKSMLTKAFSMGAKEVFVDSRIEAVHFYEKIGFSVIGNEFTERNMIHIPMKITEIDMIKCGGCHGK